MIDDDSILLRRYVNERSEPAFRELVHRHLNLVYSSALRDLRGDVHRAQDVTQRVFADLARKSALLCHRQTLAGWLYVSAHHAAAELMRSEHRRQKRELEAHEMRFYAEAPGNEVHWDRLSPVLDTIIHELKETDRDAVLLRFYEQRPFLEIARLLGLSEDAAQKRVARALEKLRSMLRRRGITSSSMAIASVLEGNAAGVAPPGLATSIVTTILSSSPMAPAASLSFISMNTLKVGVAAAVIIASTSGIIWQYINNERLQMEISALRAQQWQTPATRRASEALVNAREQGGVEATGRGKTAQSQHQQVTAKSDQAPTKVERVAIFAVAKGAVSVAKDSPQAAAQTVYEAINGGDPQALVDTIVLMPDGKEMAEDVFGTLSPEMKVRYGTPERLLAELLCATTQSPTTGKKSFVGELPGAKGMAPELANDPGYATLHSRTLTAEGRVRDSFQVFQNTPDGWRWVVSDGLVLKRFAETGLVAISRNPAASAAR